MSTNVVYFTNTSLVDNKVDSLAVILNIEPVSHIFTISVHRKLLPRKCIVDDERNKLLRELVWTELLLQLVIFAGKWYVSIYAFTSMSDEALLAEYGL